MPQIFTTSRAEAAVFRFPPLFYPLVAVAALVAQAYLPVAVHVAVYLDLPLLVVVYWASATRRAGGAATLGAALGVAQDSLAHLALGVNGIAKTLIGYWGASIGARIDADHSGMRLIIVFAAYELNRAILFGFERFLLGTPVPWRAGVTALAALVNAVLAVVLFRGMDKFRRWV